MGQSLVTHPEDTCYYDIETTNLNANYGLVLCAVVKPKRMPWKVFKLDLTKNGIRDEDKTLIKEIIKELEQYEFLVTYNGVNFDNKYINTRAMYHRLRPLSEKLQIDLLQVTRRIMRTNNRRLDTIVNFLGLEERKTPIEPEYWRWAMLGDQKAMSRVVTHCIQDVLTLEEVHQRLAPFVKNVRRR